MESIQQICNENQHFWALNFVEHFVVQRCGLNSLKFSIDYVRMGHIWVQPMFFRVNSDCTIFSTSSLKNICS